VGLPLRDLPLPELPPPLAQLVQGAEQAAFEQQLQEARQSSHWGAFEALLQAHAALQLGLTEQADDLVLDADGLEPGWGLVPDRWGLWLPQTSDSTGDLELRRRCQCLADDYLLLRHLPALELWRSWLAAVQERWQAAAEPKQLGLMALLLGRLDQLKAGFEPAMEQLIGEVQVAADPAAALTIWCQCSRRRPGWTYARLKAADLSLQRQQLQACAEHLAAATAEQRQLPWLLDIEARLAMARQQPREALHSWEEAIRLAGASGDDELAELFRQRRREAEWDAEWMAEPQLLQGVSGDAGLDRLAEQLEALARRAGVDLAGCVRSTQAPDPDAFASFLDQASGRLALAG